MFKAFLNPEVLLKSYSLLLNGKCCWSDMISGTTGFSDSGEAVLHCVGRDIENLELHLKRNGSHWITEEKIIPKPRDTFSFMIHDFILEKNYFKGSATVLVNELKMQFGVEIPSN